MTFECSQTLSTFWVPDFSSLIKRTSGNTISILRLKEEFLPEWVVEAEAVYNVFMSLEGKEFFSCLCVPHFTCTVVTSSDESWRKLIMKKFNWKKNFKNFYFFNKVIFFSRNFFYWSPSLLNAQFVNGWWWALNCLKSLKSCSLLLTIFNLSSKNYKHQEKNIKEKFFKNFFFTFD